MPSIFYQPRAVYNQIQDTQLSMVLTYAKLHGIKVTERRGSMYYFRFLNTTQRNRFAKYLDMFRWLYHTTSSGRILVEL